MIMSIVSSSIELYVDTEDESEIHVHIWTCPEIERDLEIQGGTKVKDG